MVLITLNSTLASVSSKGSDVVCVFQPGYGCIISHVCVCFSLVTAASSHMLCVFQPGYRCIISHVVCVSAWLRLRHLTCCVCFSLVTDASSHMLCVFQPGYGCVISHVVCVSVWLRCVISHVVCVSAWLRLRHLTCCVCFSLVQVLLDEIVCSTAHRCLDPVMMEPSVCYLIHTCTYTVTVL